MSAISSHVLSAGIIGAGALVWALAGRPLTANPELATPVNPLGINGSPYGEVLAMAMQGSINTYFHGGEDHECGPDCDHDHAPDAGHQPAPVAPARTPASLQARLIGYIDHLGEGASRRTNPKPATEAHKFYMRRQVEDKLRFALNLDPANYGNYNSYLYSVIW